MKKKILFFAYDLNIGGIEKSLVDLLKNLDINKYDIDLLLEKKEGPLLKEIPENINIQEYKICESKNLIKRKFVNFFNRLIFILNNKNKYSFSCCYATYSYSGNKICRIASKNSSLYIHSNYYELFDRDTLKFRNFFDKRNVNKFRKLIFVSNEAKKDFIELYSSLKNKTIVISNLINQEKILKLSKEKCEIVKPNNKKLFVFVGRIDEKSKQITKLIRVIKKIDNSELWIIGNGVDRLLVEKEIGNCLNIKLLGQKSNPYPYINLADYVILTSKYEGYPVIYNEAIILNKPIITTINITDQYMSIPNNFGYIISHDEHKMFNQIKKIVDKESFSLKHLDFNKINKKKIALLEEIIKEVI